MRNNCRFMSSILLMSVTVWVMLFLIPGQAAALTITPITWNVIGLDSNTPALGPNRFPVGARVCDGTPASTVQVDFIWDRTNPYVELSPGSSGAPDGPPLEVTLDGSGCADAYFEVTVSQTTAAFTSDTNLPARYHISVAGASTPTPRELIVEHLVSQSRNYIQDLQFGTSTGSLTSVPAGGGFSLVKGGTYYIRLKAATAIQGYEQLESFTSLPNTVFQILSVNTTYSADTTSNVDNPSDKLYGDACSWENDPDSPNYLACNSEGKIGGTIEVTYEVKIIDILPGPQSITSLIHDFSGSSFHYNSDYLSGSRTLYLVDPAIAVIGKKFAPATIVADGISTLFVTLTNPNYGPLTGASFIDIFPTSPGAMVVAPTPAAANSCGGSLTDSSGGTLDAGDPGIQLVGGTIPALSSCVVKVNVTAAVEDPVTPYANITQELWVEGSNTGKTATSFLTVDNSAFPPPQPPSSCPGSEVTLATWNFDALIAGANSTPAYTTMDPSVSSAAASCVGCVSSAISTTQSVSASNSWAASGWLSSGTVDATTTPYYQFSLDANQYGGVRIRLQGRRDNQWAGTNYVKVFSFVDDILDNTAADVSLIGNNWTAYGLTAASVGGNTKFRINAYYRHAQFPDALMYIDEVIIDGCAMPAVPPTPPAITKTFSASPVAVGTTPTLTFTVTNPNAAAALSRIAFTDTLPAGLSFAPVTASQCGGTLTLTTPDTIAFTGGTLVAAASCDITATVNAGQVGTFDNVSGVVSALESGANTDLSGIASATLVVIAPPVIAKSFAPNPILTGAVSTLTFIIENPNPNNALSGVAFSDILPVAPGAMKVASPLNYSSSGCGTPSFAPAVDDLSISFSDADIVAGGICTVTVDVTVPTEGDYDNTTSNVSHTLNGAWDGNTASATLTVTPVHPSISLVKQVSTTVAEPSPSWSTFVPVDLNGNVWFRFTVENTGDVPLTSVDVSEDPDVLYLDITTCSWQNGSGTSLTAPFALPVAVAGNDDHIAVCQLGPIVAATAGSYLNTATVSGTYVPTLTTVTDSSTARFATYGLALVKSVTESYFGAAGGLLHYFYLVTNSGAAPLTGAVTITDDKFSLPLSCPSVSTVGDGDNILDPGEAITCSADYTVTAADVTAKSITNVASATTTGVTSPTDTVTVALAPDLTAAKTNNVGGSLMVGNSFTWVLTASNAVVAGDALFADGQVLLTDDLPVSGATYGLGSVNTAGSTGIISCAIDANTLTCRASGAVNIPAVMSGVTVGVTNGAATVTGTGTAFTSQYTAGSNLLLAGVAYTVLSITDDTHLTLTTPYAGATTAGLVVPASFSVPVTVTTIAAGSLVNPKGGGICQVDPGTVVGEIDDDNNLCADTVTVRDYPSLLILKSVQPFSDPINGETDPKAIPGSLMTYTILVTNTGPGTVDADTTVITDPIPANTELFVGDIGGLGSGPVLFSDGATSSGLSYTFTALNDGADGLSFADALTAPAYTKADVTADANQCDATVTNLKISLTGVFAGSDGTNHPSFSLKFRVRVQ